MTEIIRLETGEEHRRGCSLCYWTRDRRMLIVLKSQAGEDLLGVLRPDRRSLTSTQFRTGGIGQRMLKVIRKLKSSSRSPSSWRGFPNLSDPGAGKKPPVFSGMQRKKAARNRFRKRSGRTDACTTVVILVHHLRDKNRYFLYSRPPINYMPCYIIA